MEITPNVLFKMHVCVLASLRLYAKLTLRNAFCNVSHVIQHRLIFYQVPCYIQLNGLPLYNCFCR